MYEVSSGKPNISYQIDFNETLLNFRFLHNAHFSGLLIGHKILTVLFQNGLKGAQIPKFTYLEYI